MSHATHFLERLDRVPRSLTDFALSLYRDESRTRWIVHYAHLPVGENRIALALADSSDAPHIVVTREGRFVTALGPGMGTGGLRVLSRAQVDAFSARVDDQRRRFEIAAEIVPEDKQPIDVLRLVKTRPWGLSREEFEGIAAWAPIYQYEILLDLFGSRALHAECRDLYLKTTSKAAGGHPQPRDRLLKLWNVSHAMGALFLLGTMGDLTWVEDFASCSTAPFGPTWYATDERIRSVGIRGAWAAARMGKHFFPTYKRVLSTPSLPTIHYDAVVALTAIGLRHAHLADDAQRIIHSLAKLDNPLDPGGAWAQTVLRYSATVFEHREACLESLIPTGAREVLRVAKRLDPQSPLAFTREEDVPRELALCAVANMPETSMNTATLLLLPWVAKLKTPEALYFPGDLGRLVRAEPPTKEIVEAYERHRVTPLAFPAVRDPAKVGRNDPCACKSGRKYKRCCAA